MAADDRQVLYQLSMNRTYASECASRHKTAVLSILSEVAREDVRTEAEAYAKQRRIRIKVPDVHDFLPVKYVSKLSIDIPQDRNRWSRMSRSGSPCRGRMYLKSSVYPAE